MLVAVVLERERDRKGKARSVNWLEQRFTRVGRVRH